MPLHSSLTDPNLHEPKGVASAANGMVYVANGVGSGEWVYRPSGWGHYADNAAEQTVTTAATKLLINGGGATTETGYLPRDIRGIGQLWDTSTSRITPIALGDAYDVRLLLPVTARSVAVSLEIDLDIGTTGAITNSIMTTRATVDKTPPFTVSYNFQIFCLATFVANGGQIFLKTDTGSVGITGPRIFLTRTHSEV